jgi:uncharacterized protein (TIGR02996 family)
MENSNQEISLLRNVIENRRDPLVLNVFADWLEENNREEANWIRSIAQGKYVRPSRYIYNKYVNGLEIGMTNRNLSPIEFIQLNSDPGVVIPPEFINKINKEWNGIINSPNITIGGNKVSKNLKNKIKYLTYYPTHDAWRINIQGVDDSGKKFLYPFRLNNENIPASIYWLTLYAIFHFDGIIS